MEAGLWNDQKITGSSWPRIWCSIRTPLPMNGRERCADTLVTVFLGNRSEPGPSTHSSNSSLEIRSLANGQVTFQNPTRAPPIKVTWVGGGLPGLAGSSLIRGNLSVSPSSYQARFRLSRPRHSGIAFLADIPESLQEADRVPRISLPCPIPIHSCPVKRSPPVSY